ncbi:MAG: hypothetical protein KGJ09_10565 [Candidatus Omnitrophica bacterium]|nr:hypothetical protein [Candidatus Omnitrophota bacterium]MDE2232448.1 hypothetical protein [Candidatus Omnitrophota bacterium]
MTQKETFQFFLNLPVTYTPATPEHEATAVWMAFTGHGESFDAARSDLHKKIQKHFQEMYQ